VKHRKNHPRRGSNNQQGELNSGSVQLSLYKMDNSGGKKKVQSPKLSLEIELKCKESLESTTRFWQKMPHFFELKYTN
jgi:hypothetical protein